MTSSLSSISQTANPGAIIMLFRIDTTLVGGAVGYFTQGRAGQDDVSFGGQEYTAIDINLSQFDTNAGGVLPTPKIKIANSNDFIQSLVNTYGDLCGCEIRRIRTFARFLDGQPDADSGAFMGPDVFLVERKTSENPIFIEWELSAAIDQQGVMLPRRQVIRDSCAQRYRSYQPTNPDSAGDGFLYPTINPCPYTGTSYFTTSGVATTKANDACSRQLGNGCQLRFPASGPSPFGGFPGSGRVQTA
jgi:lambda family phage minor tail protein L